MTAEPRLSVRQPDIREREDILIKTQPRFEAPYHSDTSGPGSAGALAQNTQSWFVVQSLVEPLSPFGSLAPPNRDLSPTS
jgi:hypothetical protein